MENLSCDLDGIRCRITDHEVFRITKYVLYTKIVRSLFFGRIVPNFITITITITITNFGLQKSQIREVPLYAISF